MYAFSLHFNLKERKMEIIVKPKFEHRPPRGCIVPSKTDYEDKVFGDLKAQPVRDRGSDLNKTAKAFQIYGYGFFNLVLDIAGGHGQCSSGTWTFSLENHPYKEFNCPHVFPRLFLDSEDYDGDMSPMMGGDFYFEDSLDHIHMKIIGTVNNCLCDTIWLEMIYADCKRKTTTTWVPFQLLAQKDWESIHEVKMR